VLAAGLELEPLVPLLASQMPLQWFMKVRDIIKAIEADGWRMIGQKGSHRQFKHAGKSGRVTVPGHPADDVAAGTLKSIYRQAQIEEPKR
jgi:predicted RNA binding protein YcfA (HicA-like mRNA interferase family)